MVDTIWFRIAACGFSVWAIGYLMYAIKAWRDKAHDMPYQAQLVRTEAMSNYWLQACLSRDRTIRAQLKGLRRQRRHINRLKAQLPAPTGSPRK